MTITEAAWQEDDWHTSDLIVVVVIVVVDAMDKSNYE
jgi:hypothetical protein